MLSQILTEKYKMSSYQNIKEFKVSSKCPVSGQTINQVLGHGQEPSVPTFITIAYYLDMPAHEISAACKAAGDDVFHRLIPSVKMNEIDRLSTDIMELIQNLSTEKKQLVLNLIKNIAG